MTDYFKIGICPLSDKCQKYDCYHKTPHETYYGTHAAYYCGNGSNGCPACVKYIEEETFSEEEFEI
jgi:hypothetical protein